MSKSLRRVCAALENAGLQITPIEMTAETRTAQQAADAVSCKLDQIAKSVIFAGQDSGKAILFIPAGGNQVDSTKDSSVAGEKLGKADATLIRQQTGFAIGGVAPVGHISPIRAFIDARLLEFDTIYAAAGTPRHVFPISPDVLVKISEAQISDFIEI